MKLRVDYPTWQEAIRRIITTINNINITGSVTLTLASTTTVVNANGCTSTSLIFLSPLDANAAAENWYVSSVADGTFTLTHANAGTTRAFNYLITNP